jgi:hypothetical protein
MSVIIWPHQSEEQSRITILQGATIYSYCVNNGIEGVANKFSMEYCSTILDGYIHEFKK